jgi:hypothetical protein
MEVPLIKVVVPPFLVERTLFLEAHMSTQLP